MPPNDPVTQQPTDPPRHPRRHAGVALTVTPLVVVVTGRSATGKTTLARELARRTGLPLLVKDDFKEAMYESLCPDGEWERIDIETSNMLGRLSVRAVTVAMTSLVRAGQSVIVESNFSRELFSPVLQELLTQFPVRFCQIHTVCPGSVRAARFEAREMSGERHPGHNGWRHFGRLPSLHNEAYDEPMDLPNGETIRVDTHVSDVDPWPRILKTIGASSSSEPAA